METSTSFNEEPRYFNVLQFSEPPSLRTNVADLAELELSCREITAEEAKRVPHLYSGNIRVEASGRWNWENTNWDSSD